MPRCFWARFIAAQLALHEPYRDAACVQDLFAKLFFLMVAALRVTQFTHLKSSAASRQFAAERPSPPAGAEARALVLLLHGDARVQAARRTAFAAFAPAPGTLDESRAIEGGAICICNS